MRLPQDNRKNSQKVLVLGGTGMLGHKLVQQFAGSFETYCTIRGDSDRFEHLDLIASNRAIKGVSAEDFPSVERAIRSLDPDCVVNAIGIIKQLASSTNLAQTLTVNSILPHRISGLANELGFRLINISTDCVFSGEKGNYTEGDPPDATDLYGMSKFLGEVSSPNSLTLRTSMIGREIESSHSLVEWFLAQKYRVNGYSKAIYTGFPTVILAELIGQVISDFPKLNGLYHVSSDPISKYDLLKLIKCRLSLNVGIERYEDFQIDRSLDSSRFRKATGFMPLPWPQMVDRMFSDPTPYDEWTKS